MAVVTLLSGAILWRGGGTQAALVQVRPLEVIGEADRGELLTVLDELHLDRSAMTALNLTGAQAESLLAGAQTSYASALRPLDSDIDQVLSASQIATWAIIRTGHGQHMPHSMLIWRMRNAFGLASPNSNTAMKSRRPLPTNSAIRRSPHGIRTWHKS